jgi:hypothetical protein
MRGTLLPVLASLLLAPGTSRAADWAPAAGPLTTRWAKDIVADQVHREYPRPQMVRKDWMNLNGLWEFAIAGQKDAAPVGKKLAGQILVPFPVESALSGVMKPAQRVWYRRTFDVKKEWAGKRLLLHFGAVNWEATVSLNGKQLTRHRGGYDGFSLDITEALNKDGPQELLVGVWNPIDAGAQPRGKQVRKPGGIFYTASTGIWQTVWLEPVPPLYVEGWRIVTDLAGGAGRVRVRVQCRGDTQGHNLVVKVGDARFRETSLVDAEPVREVVVQVPEPKLWSPQSPHLYDLHVAIQNGDGQIVDEVKGYVGIRTVAVGKDDRGVTRLFLNGKPYFQVGPLDQGFWPDGLYTAPTDEALKYDIEITRKLGFNLIRKHVKVEPERWYFWCDKLGILVWQDMPSGDKSVAPDKGEIQRTKQSAQQYEAELKQMLDGRSNHPCIVMWVPFNEGWGQYDTQRIAALVKKHDPSRLVDCASGWNDYPCGDVHDIHVYPGPGSPQPEENRAAVLGEFGGLGLALKGHTWDSKTWSYRGVKDGADLTRKYEQLMRKVYLLKDKPGLSAAVYTQTTDVETEANGLLTYDRAVIKLDMDRVAAANRGDFSQVPQARTVVPASQEEGQTWRYKLEKPAAGWQKPDFDDQGWKEGRGGFGTKGTPGAVVRTEWKTADIWLRRAFTMPEGKWGDLALLVHHDEDVEVYINGVLAAEAGGYLTDYEELPIRPEALQALKPGRNVFAVHCHQTVGGQYIDVGMVELKAGKK